MFSSAMQRCSYPFGERSSEARLQPEGKPGHHYVAHVKIFVAVPAAASANAAATSASSSWYYVAYCSCAGAAMDFATAKILGELCELPHPCRERLPQAAHATLMPSVPPGHGPTVPTTWHPFSASRLRSPGWSLQRGCGGSPRHRLLCRCRPPAGPLCQVRALGQDCGCAMPSSCPCH